MPNTISVLAFRMFSRLPSFSRWATPTLVITPMSGLATRVSSSISPRAHMPISSTAAWWLRSSRKMVWGRPTSVFWLPRFFSVWYFALNTVQINSLVVVFPTLPVTPTTFRSKLSR